MITPTPTHDWNLGTWRHPQKDSVWGPEIFLSFQFHLFIFCTVFLTHISPEWWQPNRISPDILTQRRVSVLLSSEPRFTSSPPLSAPPALSSLRPMFSLNSPSIIWSKFSSFPPFLSPLWVDRSINDHLFLMTDLLCFCVLAVLAVTTYESPSLYVGGHSHHVLFVRSLKVSRSLGVCPMSPCSQISAITLARTVLPPKETLLRTTAALDGKPFITLVNKHAFYTSEASYMRWNSWFLK